jgi:PAS domain-containing protein
VQLRTEIGIGIGILLGFQVATTLVVLRQLAIVGPTIDVVLRENVASLEAAEDMLAALTDAQSPSGGGHSDAFDDALALARAAKTEQGEEEQLDKIAANIDAAMSGDPWARGRVVSAIREISSLNRKAMSDANDDVGAIANMGAWSAVIFGLLSFWVSHIVSRRLRARLEAPLIELDLALEGVRRGERMRRVGLAMGGPAEATRIAENLNWLLDREKGSATVVSNDATLHRALALHALDHDPLPTVVIDRDGQILAANRAALARHDPGGGGIPRSLRRVPPSRPDIDIDGWRVEPLPDHDLWVWRHHPDAPPEPAPPPEAEPPAPA